jgi:hypothetical protein
MLLKRNVCPSEAKAPKVTCSVLETLFCLLILLFTTSLLVTTVFFYNVL